MVVVFFVTVKPPFIFPCLRIMDVNPYFGHSSQKKRGANPSSGNGEKEEKRVRSNGWEKQ